MIVGRAQLLLSRTDDPETARSLRIMINQAGRAHRILRDLMFVGRPPARRLRPAVRPSCCATRCATFRRNAPHEESGSPARSTRPFRPAWTDPDALRHLADILIRNAIQATPSGGKIQVGSRVQKDELLWWFIDSGRGLDSAEAAHLFDPFYCGRQAGRGLGLGLPRAARIVAQAGGRLRWTSHPGQGTVFHVNLPLPAAQEQPRKEPASSSRPTRNGDRPHRGEPAFTSNRSRHPGPPDF